MRVGRVFLPGSGLRLDAPAVSAFGRPPPQSPAPARGHPASLIPDETCSLGKGRCDKIRPRTCEPVHNRWIEASALSLLSPNPAACGHLLLLERGIYQR